MLENYEFVKFSLRQNYPLYDTHAVTKKSTNVWTCVICEGMPSFHKPMASHIFCFQFSASIAISYCPLVQSILQQCSAPSADVLCDQLEAKQYVAAEHYKFITDLYNSLMPLHLCTDLFYYLVHQALLTS